MGLLPENLSEKALDVKKALAALQDDVVKTISPYALSLIDQYAERYAGIKPKDLKKTLGITAEQQQAATRAAAAEAAGNVAGKNNSHDTQDNTTETTPSPIDPPPTTDPDSTPSAEPPAPTPEIAPPSPVLPLETLRQQYATTAALRDTATITGDTRTALQKQLDFALRLAPNYLLARLSPPSTPTPDLGTLEKAGIKMDTFSPLVDLSAFNLSKVRSGTINLDALKEKGLTELVLMEDRDPLFFLNFQNFSPDSPVPLNRHGNPNERWTMADLKRLMDLLHQSGIKMTIGFWGNTEKASGNPFLTRNYEALKPMIPGSTDLNPLSIIRDEQGREMPFADYILQQYKKLHQSFGFDGLFLGDGLMGYRDFQDPNAPYDFSQSAPLWTDFYKRIYQGVHEITPDGKLWAYDVLGKSSADTLKSGVDLQAITPYLDTYVFQAYGSDAWGKDYMALPGYDLARDEQAIATLPPALQQKTKYTVSIGDRVEGWQASSESIAQKGQAIAPHAQQGGFGVWSNEALRQIM